MAKITRFNGNLQAFASAAIGTERTIFGSVTQANDLTSQINADFLRGWGIVGPSDQPTIEDFNAAMYTHGQLLAYLHQVGIAEYNSAQEYHAGSITVASGVIYRSLINTNVGNNPASSPSSWESKDSGKLIKTTVVSTTGTFTPDPRSKTFDVTLQGSGGAGGGAVVTGASIHSVGSGGGSGGIARGVFTAAQVGASIVVTLGAGGAGVAGGSGNGGGTSTFGSLMTATGGSGGVSGPAVSSTTSAVTSVGSAGSGSGGNIYNSSGVPGAYGLNAELGSVSGGGGGSPLVGGAGGGPAVGLGQNGIAGIAPGSGGSGAANSPGSTARPGGNGITGSALILEYA